MSFLNDHYLAITIGEVEIDLSRTKTTNKKTKAKELNEVVVVQPAYEQPLVLDTATISKFSSTLGDLYPTGLGIDLKDFSFAEYDKTSATNKSKIFATNFSFDLELSKLPLVGHMFPKDLTFSVEDCQMLFSTKAITDASELSNQLPSNIGSFPASIQKDINFAATFKVGEETVTVSTGSLGKWNATVKASDPSSSSNAGGNSTSQGNVNKKFGPVFVQSLGIKFTDNVLWLDITGSIKLGPLTVSLMGLEIGSPLNEFSPEADLHGLSVDYKKNQVTIGGGLVKTSIPQTSGPALTAYNGALAVDLTKFQLSAIGSYANDHGNPSLFVYAVLNEPLGGPTFFFVTGLAFTFGINRNLIKPAVQDVSSYPLITAAAGKNPASGSGTAALIPPGMNTYLPPEIGEYFLGVGVKFNSFKVINSFALFVVKFGKELEFDLLGVSSYIAPNPKDPKPVATVELEIVGSYKPSTGTLLIRGMLTPNSFVLSKECHLQGGFAIAIWTANSPYSGQFVFTFGGYGNHYVPKEYYPQGVPELGFLWQINSDLSIKGGGYWVLTPHRVLAGGFLKAVFDIGWFKASFNVNAFFEIDWSPFHYYGHFSVEFSLEVKVDLLFVSFWLGFTVGEALTLHGPEFGGEASISLYVCTVDIAFGAAPAPKPLLDWAEFYETYTAAKVTTPATATKPAVMDDQGMVKINLTSGLVKTAHPGTDNELWIINPKDLCLSVKTFVPNSSCKLNKAPSLTGPAFGIKPMGIDMDTETGAANSKLVVTITNEENDDDSQFKIEQVVEGLPQAIWGGTVNEFDDLTISASTGVDILPAQQPTPGETAAVDSSILAWGDNKETNSFDLGDVPDFTVSDTSLADLFDGDDSNQTSVLSALGFSSAETTPDDAALKTRLKDTSGYLVGSYNS